MKRSVIREVKVSKAELGTILEFAEMILENAKSGRLTGIAAAFTYFDGQGGHGWASSKYTNHVALVGEVEILKGRIIEELGEYEEQQD